MATFNKVILVGHLGNDPVVRTLESEVKVADFSIATHEFSGNDKIEATDWHEVVAWRKQAEFSEKFLKKGNKVLVEGRLKTSTWLDKESGKQRRSVFVLAERIRFMDKRESKAEILADVEAGQLETDHEEELF